LSNEEKTNDYENFEKGMIYMKILIKRGGAGSREKGGGGNKIHAPCACEFHYNRIKKKYLTFMVTMTMTAIVKMSNPKCTSTHHKDHSCEVSLQSNQMNIF
jgi:hypothetical protein